MQRITKMMAKVTQRKSVSWTRGDNNNIEKFLLIILLVVICVSKGFSVANAAVTPEVELQQLTNEKMRYFSSQEVRSGNLNHRQQQQQLRQQLQVIANDLQEQPAEVVDAGELSSQKNKQQQNLASGEQQAQTTSGNSMFVSQGNVINGNHATYVEPPADFKPIIYDYDKQQQQQQQQQQHQHQQSQSRQPNEGLESSFNRMMPIFANRLSPIQQHQQPQTSPDSTTASDNPLNGGDKASSFASSPALKPSIGRWSEWHDMSIEPDLASSDSLAQETFYSLPHYAPFALPPPAFVAPYRTRYQARPEYALKGAKTNRETMPDQHQHGQQRKEQKQRYDDDEWVPKLGQNVGQFSISGNQEGSVVKPTTLSQLQIKGGQRITQPSSASGPIKISTTPTGIPEMTPSKLALNQLQVSQNNNANSNNVKLQQNHDFNQQQASTLPASGLKQQQQQSTGIKSGLQQKQAARQSKNQRRLKRRRKSKTNAEVRIQQLVAASQYQQELLANAGNKQVNGLAATVPASSTKVFSNQKQQQYQQTSLLEHSTGHQLLSKQQPVHQLPAQEQLNNLLSSTKKLSNNSQVDSERVFNARQPIKSLNYQTLGNIHLNNRPAIIVKRFGNFPVSSQVESQSAPNASSVPIIKAPHSQQQRKRKIKTQLPVGLSSWFLGGIRDLDGRHWHLPAEVISRLAVNDVDLAGYDKAPKVGIPVAGSVILVPAQNIDRATPVITSQPRSNEPPTGNRVSINQLIPR